MESMYQQLRSLPLFQGASDTQMKALVEKVPFHFTTYAPGETILEAGQPCTHVCFIVSGSARLTFTTRGLQVTLHQTLHAPGVIAPDYLFGRTTCYPFTVTAYEQCGIMRLLKSDYVKILQSDKVFLFNILNYLSHNSQKFTIAAQSMMHASLTERLALMIGTLTQPQATNINLSFKQKDLCALLGAQRTTLIHTLDQLQAEGLITYTATSLTVLKPHDWSRMYKPTD